MGFLRFTMQQTLIFSDLPKVEVVKPKTGKGSGKPRGKYKPRQVKPKTISKYDELQQLQYEIALLLDPAVLFQPKKEELTDYPYFNFWCSRYNEESYEYKGETFQGEKFEIISAELKETQTLGIKERIYLHNTFLNLIKQGDNMTKAAQLLQPIILKFKEGVIFSDKQDNALE